MRRKNSGRERLRLVQREPKKKRRRPLRIILLLFSFLVVALLLLKVGDSYCRVDKIMVNGNFRLSEEAVISHSGIKKGTSLLLLKRRKAEEKLAALPGVRSASVKKEYLSTVQITVQERVEAASLLDQNRFWLIDDQGVLFAEQSHPAENLPVITGAATAEISAGHTLAQEKKSAALCLLLEALSIYPQLEPAELNISDPASLILYTADGRRVLLGDGKKIIDKLALLQAFLQEGGPGRRLDLRAGDRLVVMADGE